MMKTNKIAINVTGKIEFVGESITNATSKEKNL